MHQEHRLLPSSARCALQALRLQLCLASSACVPFPGGRPLVEHAPLKWGPSGGRAFGGPPLPPLLTPPYRRLSRSAPYGLPDIFVGRLQRGHRDSRWRATRASTSPSSPAGVPALRSVSWNACSLFGGTGTAHAQLATRRTKLEHVGSYYGKNDVGLFQEARSGVRADAELRYLVHPLSEGLFGDGFS